MHVLWQGKGKGFCDMQDQTSPRWPRTAGNRGPQSHSTLVGCHQGAVAACCSRAGVGQAVCQPSMGDGAASVQGQLLVEPCAYKEFQQQATINSAATGADDVYPRTLRSTQSVLRCPAQKKGRVSMLRAALGHASNRMKENNDPKADRNLRRTMSSTLDTQPSYERQRQALAHALPDAIAE